MRSLISCGVRAWNWKSIWGYLCGFSDMEPGCDPDLNGGDLLANQGKVFVPAAVHPVGLLDLELFECVFVVVQSSPLSGAVEWSG